MNSRNAAPMLIAAAIISACARKRPETPAPMTTEARESVLLTKNLATGRRCAIVDPNAPLPRLETVVDTAALPEYLKQGRIAADSGYALYSLRFDSTGKPVRARLIEATIPEVSLPSLQQALASALVNRAPGAPVAARLRIDFTPAPALKLGKSEYCEPEPAPRITPMFQVTESVIVPSGPGAPLRVLSHVKYDLLIAPSGVVTDVQFLEIDPRLQPELHASLLRSRWRPALDDGLPVEAHLRGEMNDLAALDAHP